MAFARFFRCVLVFLALSSVISAESLSSQSANIVYTRYVRRKPTRYSRSKYIKEVVEVFNTRRRPPPFAFLNDEDLTRFVRCDYDPSLSGCDDAGIVTTVRTTSTSTQSQEPRPTTTTTTVPSWISRTTRTTTTTEQPSGITTTTVNPWFTRTTSTTLQSPTTTKTIGIPWFTTPTSTTLQPPTTTTTLPSESTTTEELPLLPDISEYEDNNEEDTDEGNIENGEEYEEEADEDNETTGQDDNYVTDDNEADYTGTDEELTSETDVVGSQKYTKVTTTTAKPISLFKWF